MAEVRQTGEQVSIFDLMQAKHFEKDRLPKVPLADQGTERRLSRLMSPRQFIDS